MLVLLYRKKITFYNSDICEWRLVQRLHQPFFISCIANFSVIFSRDYSCLFFPSQYQSDDTRIALPAFCHMVAPEVEFEDEILSGIQCLASLAEPVVAVALCQLDNLGRICFRNLSPSFSPRISNTLFNTWKKMW